jgi:hypothetical protein
MAEHWNPTNEDTINATQADYDSCFRMFRPTGAPPPLERENPTAYRRRLAETLQQHAPNCQDFDVRYSTATAFDVLEDKSKLMRRENQRARLIYQKGR